MYRGKIFFVLFLFICNFNVAQKPELVVPIGHTGQVRCLAFSSDGDKVISGAEDNMAKIWSISEKKLIRTLKGHSWYLSAVGFNNDNSRVLTASLDNTVKVWDVASGSEMFTLKAHGKSVRYACFSPDGKMIISCSDDRNACIWNGENGSLKHTLRKHKKPLIFAAFSTDGRMAATTSEDQNVILWNTENGNMIRKIKAGKGKIYFAKFLFENSLLFTASTKGLMEAYSVETGKKIYSFNAINSDEVLSGLPPSMPSFSNSGELICIPVSSSEVGLFNAHNGEKTASFFYNNIERASISPDAEKVFVVDNSGSSVCFVETRSAKLTYRQETGVVTSFSLSVSPCGSYLLMTNGYVFGEHTGIDVYDAQTADYICNLQGETCHTEKVRFNNDKSRIVIASQDNTAKILDARNGRILFVLKGHEDWVSDAYFSHDGTKLITASWDNTAKIWDAESGLLLHTLTGHDQSLLAAGFSYNGKIAATASFDNTLKLWDAESGILLHTLRGHKGCVFEFDFSPDDGMIATASGDHSIGLWNTGSGELIRYLSGHKDQVKLLAFTKDGKNILSSSDDFTVRYWDVYSGKLLETIPDYRRTWYSPDNDYLLVEFCDNSVSFFIDDSVVYKFKNDEKVVAVNWQENLFVTHSNSVIHFYRLPECKKLCSYILIGENDWAVVSPQGLFDASEGAMEKMYFIQGDEFIEFSQLKDVYYEPGLWRSILSGENIRQVRGIYDAFPLYPEVAQAFVDSSGLVGLTLLNRGGGIGQVRILVNGKEILADARGGNAVSDADSLSLSIDISGFSGLLPGTNSIEVITSNMEGSLTSRGIQLDFEHKKEKTEAPSVYILCSGVSDYEGNAIDLKYAAKDAEDMASALELAASELFGTDRTHVFRLTSAQMQKDKKPNRENILATIRQIASEALSTDIFVIYLSGHGINIGGSEGDFYYLTADAFSASPEVYASTQLRQSVAISSRELTELLKQIPAQKQVMILDACASGRVVEEVNLLAQKDISSSTLRALDRMRDRTGTHIISGCAADAVSYEASRFGQGLLTYALLEGIRGGALREGRFVDVTLLFSSASDRVPSLAKGIGGIQEPRIFSASESFDIGEVSEDIRRRIPLAEEKPVFIMSSFQDEESFDDLAGLEGFTDEQLRIIASSDQPHILFLESKSFSNAYRIRGQYKISENSMVVRVRLFRDKEIVADFSVSGQISAIQNISQDIVKQSVDAIKP
jgi:WD40 repeat protein